MKLDDIYVLIKPSKVEQYLDYFIFEYLDGYKEEVCCYEYPPYFGDTEFETENYKEMISFILGGNDKMFRFYFEDQSNDKAPKAMVFLNKDKSLVLGLGVYPEYTDKYLVDLKNDFGNAHALVCNEILPPDSYAAFESLSRST